VSTAKEQRELASASASVEEAINAIKTVVAFGEESGEAQRSVCHLSYIVY